jgi:hypothetical protein
MSEKDKALNWLFNGEKGMSSEYLCATLLGIKGVKAHPHDPSDLRRCFLLVDVVPSFKAKLMLMQKKSKEWSVLVKHWDELEELLLSECHKYQNYMFHSAPRTYARMKELFKSVESTHD